MAATILEELWLPAQIAMFRIKTYSLDVWVTMTMDESNLDWQTKRLDREEYVYDSGCLTCHRNLETATQDKKYHDNYFDGVTGTQCVTCHEEIGHSNLNKYLLETKYKYRFYE